MPLTSDFHPLKHAHSNHHPRRSSDRLAHGACDHYPYRGERLAESVTGIKPGLANAITIAVLIRYGLRMAVWVALLRVLVGSLLLGTFLSPTFMLSLSGALASMALLAAGWVISSRLRWAALGPVGYSVLAAMAHMAGQFWVAYTLFIPHPGLLHLLPVLMTAAVSFGVVSGIITAAMLEKMSV